MADITRATELTPEIEKTVDDMFVYHEWDEKQKESGIRVRAALSYAVKVIIANVPPGPDRSAAIRKVRDARMDANSSITHGGKY